MTRTLVTLLGLSGLGMALAGCNTMHGFGQDMSATGDALSGVTTTSRNTPASATTTAATTNNSPTIAAASDQRVTVRQEANLRDGPSTTAKIVGHAKPGDDYRVYTVKGGWTQVGDNNSAQGWIYDGLISPTTASTAHQPNAS
jgi:predicted small secreted protein